MSNCNVKYINSLNIIILHCILMYSNLLSLHNKQC